MGEADPVDQPSVEPEEVEDEVFVEEIKAIRDLLEKNHPLVSGLEDRVQERKVKAKENVQHIERKEEDIELAIELADRVFQMRMTFQNFLQLFTTEYPPGMVLDMKKIKAATCLDDLETLFGPTETDIDELVNSGGRMKDLVEKFPRISLKDDRPEVVE